MPRPHTDDPDLAELLRQCLSGLITPLPALHQWIDRFEVRP